MAQIQKMEVQMEIKSSAARFFQIIRSELHLLPKICSEYVNDIKVIKGDWESVGSIRKWSYMAGDSETAMDEVEAIDDENKAVILKFYGGAIDKYYKNWKTKINVTGNLVKWTMEFEKKNDDVPIPTNYKDNVHAIIKSIDDYLAKNA